MPPLDHLTVANERIVPSVSAKNLRIMRVILNSRFTFDDHIDNISKLSYFQSRNIAAIKKYLPRYCLETIKHALISSRLNYCNLLLCGVPKYSLQKVQHVQNTAARILTHTKKSAHITPVLVDLHWLRVLFRIQYKILLFVYKSLNDLDPSYLRDLLHYPLPLGSLRSSINELLQVPMSRLKTYGDRSFSVVAPKLWNTLPLNLRKSPSIDVFKKSLKTYLFNQFLRSS